MNNKAVQQVIEKVSYISSLLGYKQSESDGIIVANSKTQNVSSIELIESLKNSLGVRNTNSDMVLDFILALDLGLFIFDNQFKLVYANNYGHDLAKQLVKDETKSQWTEFCWRWFKTMNLVAEPQSLSQRNNQKQVIIKEWGDRSFQINQLHLDDQNGTHSGTIVLVLASTLTEEELFKSIVKKTDLFKEVAKLENVEQQLNESRQALVESEKLSSIGVMAGQIAHEILNPLSIASLKLENLKHNIKDNNLKSAEDSINKIESMLIRITKIVKSLRGMVRKDDEDPFVFCSFREIIDDTLTICAEQARSKKIKLTAEGPFDVRLPCRSGQLVQVLLNLIRNSIDELEARPDSWIKLDGKVFDIDNVKFLEVIVSDSGKGIPDEVVRRLMTPFFTTKKSGKGTGIGLNLSRKICNDHKGTLEYRLHNGHTAFVITLPL